jgi:hypothetical protein
MAMPNKQTFESFYKTSHKKNKNKLKLKIKKNMKKKALCI